MTLKELKGVHGIENIKSICGGRLGEAMEWLIKEADSMDKELDIVHAALTELYNIEGNVAIIKKCLNDIEKTKEQK